IDGDLTGSGDEDDAVDPLSPGRSEPTTTAESPDSAEASPTDQFGGGEPAGVDAGEEPVVVDAEESGGAVPGGPAEADSSVAAPEPGGESPEAPSTAPEPPDESVDDDAPPVAGETDPVGMPSEGGSDTAQPVDAVDSEEVSEPVDPFALDAETPPTDETTADPLGADAGSEFGDEMSVEDLVGDTTGEEIPSVGDGDSTDAVDETEVEADDQLTTEADEPQATEADEPQATEADEPQATEADEPQATEADEPPSGADQAGTGPETEAETATSPFDSGTADDPDLEGPAADADPFDEAVPEVELPDIDSLGEDADEDAAFDDSTFTRDEGIVEFESRFAERFVDSDVLEGKNAPLVRQVATTIEESNLNATRFRSSLPSELRRSAEPRRTERAQTISVDVANADKLLNLVEELSLAHLQLESQVEGDDAEETMSMLDSAMADLRKTVMNLRLMPLSTVVDGLPRVVRDIARRQGKRAAFEVDDEGVHLDRSIIDRLGDPLVHLVRNAVDHGIESPDDRERKNKPPEGTVTLRARRERERVVIEVVDDGRGVSAETVRRQAVEADIVSEREAERMPLNEVYELVFEPGFSTTSEVTDISGRGVGMDVVKRTITELDGSVEVQSEPDAGTTVRLSLPVSVAVSEVLFVEVGGEEFGIPTRAVDAVESAARGVLEDDGVAVETDADEPSEHLPLIHLGDALEVPGVDEHVDPEGMVVKLEPDTRAAALYCDAVTESREVVVKPYEGLLGGIPGVSGATMRGDRTLVNIIDVITL
ncbi:MAG: ATP-binding protein, partial [Halobacteriota archaeon]